MIEESAEEISVEVDESSVNEEELDAEINKSALINLIEGALVEGVRRGVSDIHLVPKSSTRTEIHFKN
jgi:type IV pilus assembly protein PilB